MGKTFKILVFSVTCFLTNAAYALSLNLLIFNVQKMENANWDLPVLQNLVAQADISILQESVLHMPRLDEDFNQHFYKSWGNEDYDTGLGTITRFDVEEARVLFSPTNEPVSNTPKISVIEIYDLPGTCENLMVINTHGINFRGLSHFRKQMNSIYEDVKEHEGPMVWAGDFNTRNSARKRYLISVADSLGLTEVKFKNRSRKGFALDRAFTRGFDVKEATEIKVKISDHEPLFMELEY